MAIDNHSDSDYLDFLSSQEPVSYGRSQQYLNRCSHKAFRILEIKNLERFHGRRVTHKVLILNNAASVTEELNYSKPNCLKKQGL